MNFRKKYLEEQFNPGFLAIFINPFFFSRKGLFNAIKTFSPALKGVVLDVGCGQKPYKSLFENSDKYVGIELDTESNRRNSKADFLYDGITLPFESDSFDSIICNQVFEHVFDTQHFLKEMHRVLKKNGHLLITVPFIWDEHEQPNDFARYTSFGMENILNQNGFNIQSFIKTQPNISVIFQLINLYLYKSFWSRYFYINLFLSMILLSNFNLLGLILTKILPSNLDLYLDNVILAVKE